jgi:serine/threonine protein kinase
MLQNVMFRFVFIALELSPASLYDVIEKQSNQEFAELRKLIPPKTIMYEIMAGIQHLHSLKIVHRGIPSTKKKRHQTSKYSVLVYKTTQDPDI